MDNRVSMVLFLLYNFCLRDQKRGREGSTVPHIWLLLLGRIINFIHLIKFLQFGWNSVKNSWSPYEKRLFSVQNVGIFQKFRQLLNDEIEGFEWKNNERNWSLLKYCFSYLKARKETIFEWKQQKALNELHLKFRMKILYTRLL